MRYRFRVEAGVCHPTGRVTAVDDEQERRARLPLLGKGAVLAHRFDHPLATAMDEGQEPRQAPASTALPCNATALAGWPVTAGLA